MRIKRFTEKVVRDLKPPEKPLQVDVFELDKQPPGLCLRVSYGGVKAWYMMAGDRHSLGRWPEMSVKEARSKAYKIYSERTTFHRTSKRKRFDTLVAEYIAFAKVWRWKSYSGENHSERQALGLFEREILPRWGKLSIAKVTRDEIIKAIEERAKTSPSQANQLRMNIQSLFNWLHKEGKIESNPTKGLPNPFPNNERTRKLSDEELTSLLVACRDLSKTQEIAFRFLLYTGCRKLVIRRALWKDFDEKEKTLKFMDKGRRGKENEFELPLVDASVKLLVELRELSPDPAPEALCWSSSGGKLTVDFVIRKLRDATGIRDFAAHDFRRTMVKVMMQKPNKVDYIITEYCLHHSVGSKSSQAYHEQPVDMMRDAFLKWYFYLFKLELQATGRPLTEEEYLAETVAGHIEDIEKGRV